MSEKPTYEELEKRVKELERAEYRRTMVEDELRSTNRLLEGVLDGVQDIIGIQDTNHAIIRYNKAGYQALDMKYEEVVGRPCYALLGRSETCENCATARALKSKMLEAVERFVPELGRHFLCRSNPVLDDEGEVRFIIEQLHDITDRKRSEEKLLESEARFRRLIDTLPYGIEEVDLDGRAVFLNNAYHRMLGYKPGSLVGSYIWDHDPDAEHVERLKAYFEYIKSKQPEPTPYGSRNVRKDGEIIDVQVDWNYIRDDEGRLQGFISVVTDITRRKEAEKALEESEERFRAIFESMSAGSCLDEIVYKNDRPVDYRIVNVNPSYERIMGISRSEAINALGSQLYGTGEALFLDVFSRVADSGVPESFEAYFEPAQKYLEFNVSCPFRGMFSTVFTDITQRKQAESAFLESEEKFQKAFQSAPLLMTITSIEDGRFLDVNDAFVSVTGYSREVAIGSTSTEIGFLRLEDRNRIIETLGAGSRVHDLELTLKRADGSKMVCLYSAEIVDIKGPKRLLATAIDVTDRKNAEEALRESERRFRTLFLAAPVSILALQDGKYSIANPASARLLGYESPEEIIGLDALSTIPPEYHETIRKRMANIHANQGNAPIEIPVLHPDGGLSWSMSASAPIELEGKPAALIIGQDITRQKRAENEKERLLSAIEQAAEVIVITDPDGLIQYVNPAFEKITGYAADEVRGENPRILKSGKQDAAFYENLWETITGGKTWQGRLVNKKKDGTFYTEEASISPVVGKEGQIHNFVAVKRDITSEIEMERRLAQAQKMEAIGTLAGGIAHDFNNILSAILGFSELVEEELPESSQSRSDLEEVLKAAQRAKGLVKQILTFSRRGEQEARPLRMDLVVKETLKMLRSSLPSSIEVRHSIGNDLPLVVADPIQVHQILLNLCTNAAQAMEKESGTLEILLDTKDFDKEAIIQTGRLSPGSYVRLCVSDTGSGIPKDLLERIFEPYFTTKKAGEGTGLGLAVVYGIVKDYGGGISVESGLGKGTTFTLYLPAAEEAEPMMAGVRQSRLPWGKERILFVDDELPIIKLGKEYLARLGYDVVTMQDSTSALEIFRKDPDRFDLVITDMTMPKVTGDELASAILAIRPEMPIIICTGYSKRMSPERAKELGIRAFVMKPLAQHELANTVRSVLDERH